MLKGEALTSALCRAGLTAQIRPFQLTSESKPEDDSENPFYFAQITRISSHSKWQAARSVFEKTQYWPLLTDRLESLSEIAEVNSNEQGNFADNIALAESLDLTSWLNSKFSENQAYYKVSEGSWPGRISANLDGFDLPQKGKAADEVLLLLCPIAEAWQAVLSIGWGNGNDSIEPHYHAALHRKWKHDWGAELVVATDSTLEFFVKRPPQSAEETMALAREQFAYCPDMVTQAQSPATLCSHAVKLYRCEHWAFWWD